MKQQFIQDSHVVNFFPLNCPFYNFYQTVKIYSVIDKTWQLSESKQLR